MLRNPFATPSRLEQAREGAEQAAQAVRKAAKSVRDGADRVLDELPEQHRDRRPVLAAALLAGGAVAGVLAARRLLGGEREPAASDVPSPVVTPTAPGGPTEERLNDPALKAKVESELYAVESVKGAINIDVADGVVTLRGELPAAEQITNVVESVTVIDGVRRVESLLHLPGEEPATVTS
jgi:hypothetical protein